MALLKNSTQQEGKQILTNLNKTKTCNSQPTKANILVNSTKGPIPTNKIFLSDQTIIKASNVFTSCTTTVNTTTNTISNNTKPLVIDHVSSSISNLDKIVNHQSEIQSIIPTLSSQLIFSSIIATKTPRNNVAIPISQNQATNSTTTVPTITSTPTAATNTTTVTTMKTTPTKPAQLIMSDSNGHSTTTNSSRSNKSNHNKQLTSGLTSPSAIVINGHAVTGKLMDMGKRLLDAARDGHTDQVRQLVVNSGAPFTSDWLGTTALHLAAQYGHTEIADILLKGGVNRDARTKLERTALHLAAQVGCIEVVDLLLIHGSDVNARDMLKMTPLHWAVERCHANVVERLLLSGADVSAKSKFQLTPIDIAQASNRFEIMELFKNWTNCSDILNSIDDQIAATKSGNSSDLSYSFNESHDILDDYHLALDIDHHANVSSRTPTLDIDEPCIDLVELEWNTLKFEPDFFLSNDDDEDEDEDDLDIDDDEPKVEYLKKIVEELTKENRQLRQRVEQLSTTSQ